MPDSEAKVFGAVKLSFKYLPLLFVAASVGLAVGFKELTVVPFLLLGTYNAWFYLRYFQQQPDSNHWGDSSDDFRFSGFFPSFLAVVIDPIGYVLATVSRLRHPPAETKAPFAKAAQYTLPADNADANRRRERGAKALEERLGMKKTAGEGEDVEAASAAASPAAPAATAATVVIPSASTPAS
ncbi:hypothetical protein HYH03_010344 [Edaphochlamys debaryana]|uniref:Transmembrane protein n=1 Tax=Edaphochlamys debaryana TaxID=47281 RepID=A0A835XWV8_9CHLO|nr:hypothetical protein HYH03_010344 [Edaphochlamys debaryana]|eukprot:KAG2491340.1 hypothetical protein HYH03_010344 [Edaphochlamys debaryana]